MKRILFYLTILTITNYSYCQEFAFNLVFEDSKGNRDTLILGYDPNGSDSIDLEFGEKNIIEEPIDPEFEVRITNEYFSQGLPSAEKSKLHFKKQIVKNDGSNWFSVLTIDFFTKNWPVKITWDRSLFEKVENEGSLLTNFHPGGWFDVGGGFISVFGEDSSKIISDPKTLFNYKNGTDTISVVWQAFGDEGLLHLSVESFANDNFQIYPNPSNGVIDIIHGLDVHIEKVSIINLNGVLFYSDRFGGSIDVSKMPRGLYVIEILYNHKTYRQKIAINVR